MILGGYANAVSVARSLAGLGVPVYAVGDSASSVRYSRSCRAFVDLGRIGDVQARWLDWLEHGPRRGVILPCSDDGLELVARNRPTLIDIGYVPIEANDEVLLAMLDKGETYKVARRLGIATPQTSVVRDHTDLKNLEGFAYPCALKPVRSHLFERRSGVRAKAIIVGSHTELTQTLARLLPLGIEMIATEIVPGGDNQLPSYYTYLDESRKPLLHVTTRKIRQFPPGFGNGCYRLTDWDAEVAELGLRFLRGAGVRGLAMVEFKRDARDGQLRLIECNHRFTSANELVRIAGIDLATFTYYRLLGSEEVAPSSYRLGVRLWYPADDLRAFVAYRRRHELSFSSWVRSLRYRQHFPVFHWNDPGPTVAYHTSLFVRMSRLMLLRAGSWARKRLTKNPTIVRL